MNYLESMNKKEGYKLITEEIIYTLTYITLEKKKY